MTISTLKLPRDVRKGLPLLTVPETAMSPSLFKAALNFVLLVPKATVMEVNTSLHIEVEENLIYSYFLR